MSEGFLGSFWSSSDPIGSVGFPVQINVSKDVRHRYVARVFRWPFMTLDILLPQGR